MNDWSILTVSRGGAVSIMKGLTEDEARQTMQRLASPYERPDFNWDNQPTTWISFPNDSEIVRKECWGPGGIQLPDLWRGFSREKQQL